MSEIRYKAIRGEKVEISKGNLSILIDVITDDSRMSFLTEKIAAENGYADANCIMEFRHNDVVFNVDNDEDIYEFVMFHFNDNITLSLHLHDYNNDRIIMDVDRAIVIENGFMYLRGIYNLKVKEMFGIVCPDGYEFAPDCTEDKVTLVKSPKTYEDYMREVFPSSADGTNGYKGMSPTVSIERKVEAYRKVLNLAYAMNLKHNRYNELYNLVLDDDGVIVHETDDGYFFADAWFKSKDDAKDAITIIGKEIVEEMFSSPEIM